MNNLNFDEFPHADFDQWKKSVMKELGEKSFDSIQWNNPNGFQLEAYFAGTQIHAEIAKPDTWSIYQEVSGKSAQEQNRLALACLQGGANAIGFGLKMTEESQLETLLDGIYIEYISIHFIHPENDDRLIDWYLNYCDRKKLDAHQINGSICTSSYSKSQFGNLPFWLKQTARFPGLRILPVQASIIHDCGGEQMHELAFALAMGQELLHQLEKEGVDPVLTNQKLQFNFATGTSYFNEIAKYRAFRLNWKTVLNAYDLQVNDIAECYIHAETSRFQQTTKDHYNNMLRATTQCMSAIIGGADSVNVVPGYENDKSINESSLRLARNVQHLLMEESYFHPAGDVAKGSYYIEELTAWISGKSWEMFQEIEKRGGILQAGAWFNGLVMAALQSQQTLVAEGKRVVIGVNKYQNKQEKMTTEVDESTLTGFMEKA
jgi:methylmalonyl-CoA mutase